MWVVVLVVAATAGVAGSGPRNEAEAQAAGALTIVSQSPYVPAEGTFDLVFSWTGETTEDLVLTGTLFAPITLESEVQEVPSTAFAAIGARPLSELGRNEDGSYIFSLAVRSVADGDPNRTLIREAGVLPLSLEIRDGDGVTKATLRTNLIRLAGDAAEIDALPVAMILEVSSAEGLTLEPTSLLLSQHPNLPIAVQLGDGVITQLESDPDLAQIFRTALVGRSVITSPALNLDPSALASIHRPDLYILARNQTFARLDALGLVPATNIVPLDTNITSEGVDLLAQLGTTIVIDTGPTLRPTGFILGSAGSVRIVQVDSTLTSRLRGPARNVERAHRLLATLAIRSQTDRAPIVLGGAALRDVPLAAISTLLTALNAPGLVENASLEGVADSAVLPIRRDEQPSQNLGLAVDQVSLYSETMETYRSYFVTGRRPPEIFDARLLEALSPNLNPEERLRALARLQESLTSELGGIELPDGQSVTLAAQQAEIPITVNNQSDGTRLVLLSFKSDKINVKQDGTTLSLPRGTSTITIDLEALSLGQSPLLVSILTPDASTELAATRFGVRSTAIPGLGLLLSLAALVFLLGWWIVTTSRAKALRSHPASQNEQPSTEPIPS